jgi:hypothetical protein
VRKLRGKRLPGGKRGYHQKEYLKSTTNATNPLTSLFCLFPASITSMWKRGKTGDFSSGVFSPASELYLAFS